MPRLVLLEVLKLLLSYVHVKVLSVVANGYELCFGFEDFHSCVQKDDSDLITTP